MSTPAPSTPPPDLSDYTLAEIRGLLFEIDREIRKREQARVVVNTTRPTRSIKKNPVP